MSSKLPDTPWSDAELREMDTGTSTDELELRRGPIGAYIARKHRYGREKKYVEHIETVLREYEAFLYHEYSEHVCNVSDSHVSAFHEYLSNGGTYYTIAEPSTGDPKSINIGSRTRYDYLRRVVAFYDWLTEDEGLLSQNPAKKAVQELNAAKAFDLSPPNRRHIGLDEMRSFLEWIDRPIQQAIVMLFLKSGIRVGELVNLDLCCLHLDHPLYEFLLDDIGVELAPEIRNYPDTLFVEPGFTAGTSVRGEIRGDGSKRQSKTGTVIPIDQELKTALLEYILVRRRAHNHEVEARPLFLTGQSGGDNDRLSQQTIYGLLTQNGPMKGVLYEYGWYESGADTAENVTPHYFRHYFTHNHRHNQGVHQRHMPEDVIAYIRGDVNTGDGSARETNYRHDDWNVWERYIRDPYLEGLYQFGIYEEISPRRRSEQVHGRNRDPSTAVTGGGRLINNGGER